MSKITADAALLPPEEIADLAIELNRSFSGSETNKIILGKKEEETMPHMTLAMGVIEENNLAEAGKVLSEVISGYKILELTATGTYIGIHGNNKLGRDQCFEY